MLFINLYFSGAYISALLFILLLEIDSFRDYIDAFLDDIRKSFEEHLSIHNYSLMMPITSLLAFISWIGVIIIFGLIIDYIEYERK